MRPVAHLSLALGAVLAVLGPLAGQGAAQATDKNPTPFRVQGRIVDEKHQPLAVARVFFGDNDEVRRCQVDGKPVATTDAQGRFTVNLPRSDPRIVRVLQRFLVFEAEGRVMGRTLAGLRSPYGGQVQALGTQDLGDLVLPKGEPIQCRIRKKDGRPLAGAWVVAEHPRRAAMAMFFLTGPQGLDYFSQAQTDAKGAAVVYGQRNTGVKIEVQAKGYYKHSIPLHSPRMPLVLSMQESGFVEGRVVNHDGKPVAAMLNVVSEVDPMGLVNVYVAGNQSSRFTNADGTFRLNIDRRHRFRILAYPMTRARSVYSPTGGRSGVLSGPRKDVEIRLTKPKGVHGGVVLKVVDGDDKPIRDFRAAALWYWQDINQIAREYLDAMFESHALRPRAAGEALLQPPTQHTQRTGIVIVRARGYGPKIITKVRWHDDKPVEVTAKLDKEQVIAGEVVDKKTGKPVVGAEVWVVLKPKNKKSPNTTVYGGMGQPKPGAVLTDARGRFRIGSLGRGRHAVHVAHADHPKFKARILTLKAAEPKKTVKLELAHGARWFGKVKGQHHRPGWKLKLVTKATQPGFGFVTLGPTPAMPGREAIIQADGSFELKGLGNGRYTAYLMVPRSDHASGASSHLDIEIKGLKPKIDSDEEAKPVTVDISKALPAVVRGKAVFRGAPPPAGRLAVVAQGSSGGRQAILFTGMPDTGGQSCTIARDGSFQIGVAPGKQRLRVVDLATNAVLWQSEDDVEVNAGETSIQEVELELALVRLTLEPSKANQPVVASMLEVKIDWPGQQAVGGFVGIVEGPPFSGVGLPLSNGEREVTLYLPEQEVKLIVRSNAPTLNSQQNAGQPAKLGEHEFTPSMGKTNKIKIQVEKPPEIVEDSAKEEKEAAKDKPKRAQLRLSKPVKRK